MDLDDMRPRVAVIRAEALNPFEMQVYAAVRASYDVHAVGRMRPGFEIDRIPVPVHLLRSLRQVPTLQWANRLAGRYGPGLPDLNALTGLRDVVATCRILHSAETALTVSGQAQALAARTGAKHVVTCWENIPFRYEEEPVLRRRKELVRASADLFVAVTPLARDALLEEGVTADRIRVVPAGIDTDRFAPHPPDGRLRAAWGIPSDALVVGFLGRLIREKGVIDLARAVLTLGPVDGRPVHLVLVGEGDERGRARAVARALGAADRLHVVPAQGYGRVPEVFAAFDVVAAPSHATPYWQEQFGMVLAEAMACGRPVVTSRTGSIPQVVGDAAVLVPDYDVAALRSAVHDLLADEGRRAELGARARAHALARYAIPVVAPQIVAAYDAVLA